MELSKEETRILLHTPLFSGIMPEEMQALLGCLSARRKEYPAGTIVLHEGDASTEIGILLTGSGQIYRDDWEGNREILAPLLSGEMFAEAFACAKVNKLPVSVQMLQPSVVLWIEYLRITEGCSKACGFHSKLLRNLLFIIGSKNIQLTEKTRLLSGRTTREKIYIYLQSQARKANSSHFTIPFNRQQMADYLGCERSALSAELSRMQKEGLIEYSRSHFTLHNKNQI